MFRGAKVILSFNEHITITVQQGQRTDNAQNLDLLHGLKLCSQLLKTAVLDGVQVAGIHR